MIIEILDSIECKINSNDGKKLLPCLQFTSSYWKQGPTRKVRCEYQKDVFSYKGKTEWRFYTGLLPRITNWCKDQNIDLEVVGEEIKIQRQQAPFLKGITFREDQLKMIDAACEKQRGICHAATGVGKTIMMLGITSCFPKCNILILAHTIGITNQIFEKLKEFGFKDIEIFGDGVSAIKPSAKITVSTVQSFVKLQAEFYADYYDIVFIDESQHVQKMDSNYAKVLTHLLAPIKIGLTATKRTTQEAELINEGLLGETMKRITLHEATDLGILAKIKLKLIKAECDDGILDIRKYQDTYEKIKVNGKMVNGKRLSLGIYTYGIITNIQRNRQIIEIVNDFYTQGKSVLIFITQIEHGNILQDLFKKEYGYTVPFVQGSMQSEEREKTKRNLINKKLRVVIASCAWVEGIDVPNLDALVMASAGKSEIQTIQKLGRGLRKTEDKEFVIVIDFLDLKGIPLIKQTAERLATYSKNNWL